MHASIFGEKTEQNAIIGYPTGQKKSEDDQPIRWSILP